MAFWELAQRIFMSDALPPDPGMTNVVERNIGALMSRRQAEDRAASFGDRIAGAVTRFTGSMQFVYIHLALFGAWICWNLGWFGLKPFDPSFVVLAMVASVEAIFLSTFVLISQNRMAAQADKRAELDLQISLLTEHELTRLITLVRAMARHMNISAAEAEEINELERDIHPENVMDSMERLRRETQQGTKPGEGE
jgi:uncharacterized membrane protein